jgi:hypothetical protein
MANHLLATPPAPPLTLSVTDHSSTTNCQMGTVRVVPPNNHQPTVGADHNQANTTKRHDHQPSATPRPTALMQPRLTTATNRPLAQPHNTSSQALNLCRGRWQRCRVPSRPLPRKPISTHRTTHHPKVVVHAGPCRTATPAMGAALCRCAMGPTPPPENLPPSYDAHRRGGQNHRRTQPTLLR